MKWLVPAVLVACVAIAGVHAQLNTDEVPKTPIDSARILVLKAPLSQYAIENMDFVLEYKLFNVGDRTALKVSLDDRHSFPTQTFEVVKGLLQVRWEKIPPGENVTHSVIVRPRYPTVANHTAAHIAYYPKEDAKEMRVGYSTASSDYVVYRLRDYERRFASKWFSWVVFLVLCLPTTAVPFAMWFKQHNRYPTTNYNYVPVVERATTKKTK